MSEALPIRDRELLINDDTRKKFRKEIDPIIGHIFASRGFIEERSPVGRISLDSTNVQPGLAYRKLLKSPFDAMSVRTTHEVYRGERNLLRSSIELGRIGGFGLSTFVTNIDDFSITTQVPTNTDKRTSYLDNVSAEDILQDIRAHTELGYSASDVPVAVPQVISELEGLHTARNIDRRAQYEIFTPSEHGNIQMNIGESFELRDVKIGTGIQKRKFNSKKLFQLVANQPLDNGSVSLGITYRSSNKDSELKLTAAISGTEYSEDEKQSLYDSILDDYQERDIERFGRGVIRNLKSISDEGSDALRLG